MDEAEIAGFRACKRCGPRGDAPRAPGLEHVREAAAFIAAHADEPITLLRLARQVGTSPFHLQRLFARIVGISGFTVRPPRARREKPKVSAFTSARVDEIVALAPDLVIGFSDIQADIAQALFLTTKAVEGHLSDVYSKLGIGSRTDLSQELSG